MVTPLGQRMVFQTAHTEATRVLHDIANQLQREEGFKRLLADRMAEDKDVVNNISRSESLKTEEREERERRFANRRNKKNGKDSDEEQGEQVSTADGYLDFLA